MLQHIQRGRYAVLTLIIGASFFIAGRALAWQYDQAYALNLWPAQSYAPTQGRLQGSGGIDNQGKRATQPLANTVRWNQQSIDWMKSGWSSVSIAFHSSWNGNTGPTGDGSCSNWWKAVSWAATNLPAPWANTYNRNCGYTFANEVRVGGDQAQFVAGKDYWAQSWFQDTNTTADPKGQFNVDTYWGGDGVFHQKYCIPDNSNTARGC